MSWVAVGMAAVGVVQGESNRKKAENDAMSKANMIQYSPWNSVAAGMASSPVQEGPGALELGSRGAMLGAYAGKALGADKAAAVPELKMDPNVAATNVGGNMMMAPQGQSMEETMKWQQMMNNMAARNNA